MIGFGRRTQNFNEIIGLYSSPIFLGDQIRVLFLHGQGKTAVASISIIMSGCIKSFTPIPVTQGDTPVFEYFLKNSIRAGTPFSCICLRSVKKK